WNYTFIESCMPHSLSPEAIERGLPAKPFQPDDLSAVTDELPYLALGQQPREVKARYVHSLHTYIALLLAFSRQPSILTSNRLRLIANVDGRYLDFPGKLLSGAHYMFVPLGALIAILYFP